MDGVVDADDEFVLPGDVALATGEPIVNVFFTPVNAVSERYRAADDDHDETRSRKAAFAGDVKRAFDALTAKETYDMEPNDAAALALKLTADMAEWPFNARAFYDAANAGKDVTAMDEVFRAFRSADALNSSFVARKDAAAASSSALTDRERARRKPLDDLRIDFDALDRFYDAVRTMFGSALDGALYDLIHSIRERLELDASGLSRSRGKTNWERLGLSLTRLILMVMRYLSTCDDLDHVLEDMLSCCYELAATLDPPGIRCLTAQLRGLDRGRFEALAQTTQQFVTVRVYERASAEDGHDDGGTLEHAVRFLAMLYDANAASVDDDDDYDDDDADLRLGLELELDAAADAAAAAWDWTRGVHLPHAYFYNDAVNDEAFFDVKDDYRRWKNPEWRASKFAFSFCAVAPFAFDPATKARILTQESRMLMTSEFEEAMMRSVFSGSRDSPFLVVRVRRDTLVQDVLAQISSKRERDLRKPLKVAFVGEQGVDEGGVAKEFFQLFVRRVFDPSFGMFAHDDETRTFWFAPEADDLGLEDVEFELIGIVIGLAIYNEHILDFRFPMTIYRKLLGQTPSMRDLREVNPWRHQGFAKLLKARTAEEVDAFGLTFTATKIVFGDEVVVDLIENGRDVPVTIENRSAYVKAYVEWFFVDAIQYPFDAFKKGFHRLCGGPVIHFFRPEELEQLVCGCAHFDFNALEAATRYEDGYAKDDPTMRMFWRVVHAMTETQKRRLLFFATGSDRAPIDGLGALPFVIRRVLSYTGAHTTAFAW